MDEITTTFPTEDVDHASRSQDFPLTSVPREIRDMIYDCMLSTHPRLIVRGHIEGRMYPRIAAFDTRRRLTVGRLEFNRGSSTLVAMLTGSHPTCDEFLERIQEDVVHHVFAEPRDPVHGGDGHSGKALHVRHEEVEIASNAAELSINLSSTGNTSNNMKIDTEVFGDIRRLLTHCKQVRHLVLNCSFIMKIEMNNNSIDFDAMEKDRIKMVSAHIVPLLQQQPLLKHHEWAAKFINYTPTGYGTWSGKWRRSMTEYALRAPHMSREDARVSR